MKKIIFLLSILFSISAFAQKEVKVPTIVFKVPLGETVKKENVSITLAEIVEDSRCPSDVTCVWAGRSKVKVLVTMKGKETEVHMVLFERGKQTVVARTETTVFKAVKLSPYPTSATKNNLDYELLVSEEVFKEQE